MRYAFIDHHLREFRVTVMCRVLSVSKSGFCAWRSRQSRPSPRAQRRATLDRQVAAAFAARKGRCGSPTLTCDLRDQCLPYDRKTVAVSQQWQQLRAKAARKFKATTNSKHNLPVAPNLLQQDFTAQAPNCKWVGDITYLWTDEGWLYLAVIIDLYSRRVVGWALRERMTADLAGNALTVALWRRKRQTVFESIEVDYNRSRRHSANGHISLAAFEAQRVA